MTPLRGFSNSFRTSDMLSAQAVQRECGLTEARGVSAEEVGRLNPAVESEGIVGGVYCPSDGFIRPLEILRGYAEAAARLGARFEYDVTVEGFGASGRGRVGEVLTSAG